MTATNINASNQFYWQETSFVGGWSTARDVASPNYASGDNNKLELFVANDGAGSYKIGRAGATYDTSSIPSNATISAVTFYWYRKSERTYLWGQKVYICPVSDTGSSAGYFNKSYFSSEVGNFTSPLGNDQENNSINSWISTSLSTSVITKAGTTKLGFRMEHDYTNSAPGPKNDYTAMRTDDWPNNKSYLAITWTTPPAVTTGDATALQPISATLAGNVTDAGGGTVSERGVCWSTSANPTTSSSKATSAGTTGSYTVSATGLLPGTEYHYRAYVITENSTQYGSDLTFRTPGGAILFNLL